MLFFLLTRKKPVDPGNTQQTGTQPNASQPDSTKSDAPMATLKLPFKTGESVMYMGEKHSVVSDNHPNYVIFSEIKLAKKNAHYNDLTRV